MRKENSPAAQAIKVCLDGEWLPAKANMTVAAWMLTQAKLSTRISCSGTPRFAICGMGVCQECRISVNGRPQQLACQTWCEAGMVIDTGSVN